MASSLFVVGAKRTAFGTFGGKLKGYTATELAVFAGKAALASSKVDPSAVGSSVWGNVAQTAADAAYLARHVGLKCGLADASIALGVNRLCGSGFQSLVSAAHEMASGDNDSGLALVGGTESMSQAPLSVYGHHARFGHRLGVDMSLQDTLWAALTDSHAKMPMGGTAEALGAQFGVTREECDRFALESQKRWAAAAASGALKATITPIAVPGKRGATEAFEVDEHPRADASYESLAKLPPVFKKDGGLVSAGNASGICDGAAALVLASDAAVKAHGLQPLARVAGWATAGVDPRIMGHGPVPAIRALLKKRGLSLDQIDLLEVGAGGCAIVQVMATRMGRALKCDD